MRKTLLNISRVFLLLLICWKGSATYAQQIPFFTQYLYEPTWYMPALTGLQSQSEIFLGHRSQWMSAESAPSSQLLGYSGKRINGGALAAGGFLYHDQAHIFRQVHANINFAYHLLPASSSHQLSLGASLGFHHQRINLDGNLQLAEEGDPLVLGNTYRNTSPDAGIGIHYQFQQDQSRFYFGLSSSQLPQAFAIDSTLQYVLNTHLFGTIGAQFPINDQISIEPIFLWRGLPGEQSLGGGGVDLGMRVYLLEDQLLVGGGIRPQGGGFHGLLGLGLNKVRFSALYEQHAWLGSSLEFGLAVPLGSSFSSPTESPKSKKSPRVANNNPKPTKTKTSKPSPSSRRQAYWEDSQFLIEGLTKISPQPESFSVESFPKRNQVRLVYQFASDEEVYMPRKIPAVNALLDHITSTIQDILDPSKRPHLNKVESIQLISLMQDDADILNAPSYIQYLGEWGDRLNKTYSVDQEIIVESINKGKITRREQAFLKLYSIQKALSARLNISERTFIFALETEASEDYFQEIVVDITLK